LNITSWLAIGYQNSAFFFKNQEYYFNYTQRDHKLPFCRSGNAQFVTAGIIGRYQVMERQYHDVCNVFFEVSSVPLTLCRKDGEPIYWAPRTDSSDIPPTPYHSLIKKHAEATTEHAFPFVEITDPAFFFAVVKLTDDQLLILGPVAAIAYSDAEILRFSMLWNVSEEKHEFFIEQIRRVPIFSFRQFLSTISLVNYMFNGVFISPGDILLLRPSITPDVEKNLTRTMLQSRENHLVHTPMSYEHYLMQAVTEGNLPKLKQALFAPLSGTIGRMSSNPIQQEKYVFISFITMVTRAAVAGGLNQELAFSLADVYCQTVDRLENISEITKITLEMCLDFTEKVGAVKGKKKLSPGIAMSCEFIYRNLHDDVHIAQLADLVRMSPKNLSKKFREETGLSITDYIHRERINEAQSLLEYSEYSISEIGYYLQYASQSYFSSVFKKFSGVTPQQFREQLKQSKLD
jgi:YSIRK-targeted surface antigen transcriptional regulator